jgi:hypothetical protein
MTSARMTLARTTFARRTRVFGRRRSRRGFVAPGAFAIVVAFVVVSFVVGGADCIPESGIAEAADCCDCLGDFAPDGSEASLIGGNCLPTLDGVPNLGISDERQVCAEAAGRSLDSDERVPVFAACLLEGHPCAGRCARAGEVGVDFDARPDG